MTFDLEAFVAAKRPTTVDCPIAVDPEVVAAHTAARAAVDVAREVVDRTPTPAARAALAEAEDALEEAEQAAAAATQVFRFRGLSDHAWEALLAAHPATPDQVRKAKRADEVPSRWNEDTFPAALVAACSFDPELSVEDATAILTLDTMNGAETGALFRAAIDASRGRQVPDLGKGSGRTHS